MLKDIFKYLLYRIFLNINFVYVFEYIKVIFSKKSLFSLINSGNHFVSLSFMSLGNFMDTTKKICILDIRQQTL